MGESLLNRSQKTLGNVWSFMRTVAGAIWGVVDRVWTDARPVVERAATDVLIATTFWVALYFFQLLEHWLPVGGWAGRFASGLHQAGIVVALAVFVLMSIVSLWLQLKHRVATNT